MAERFVALGATLLLVYFLELFVFFCKALLNALDVALLGSYS